MKKAMIAMSGGVDSSVAACLMQQRGYRCMGTTMRLYRNEDIGRSQFQTCCSQRDIDDASEVAFQLDIPYKVLDFTMDFKSCVMEKFVRTYEAGGTPNPCIDCNRYLKFDSLLRFAREKGLEYIVTGHYARIGYDKASGRYLLKKALDTVDDRYDFILIDCPPSLELLTLTGLCGAHTILVPVQCEYFALEGLSDLLGTVRIVKRSLNPVIALEGVLLTMYDSRTNLSMQVAEEVKRHFPGQVYATVIPRTVRLAEAPSHGKPVDAYDPLSRGTEAYAALADEVPNHNS